MKKLIFILFVTLGITSCVKDDIFKGPAVIEKITITPNNITSKDDIIVTALITDLVGIKTAELNYTVNGASEKLIMNSLKDNLYSAVIPAQEDKSKIEFIITVINTNGLTTISKKQNFTITDQVINYNQIVMNEIDGNSKAIEIYNKGKESFSLEGFSIVKNNSGEWWKGTAESGIIEPGQYIVIIQNNTDNTALSGTSGISAKQTLKFEFKAPNGSTLNVFLRGPEENLGDKASDTAPNSYQICPNGEGDWKLAAPTIGSKNPKTGNDIPQN